MTPLKPSTAINPPTSSASSPARPASPPLASPALSDTYSDHSAGGSSAAGGEHTTSNFNLGKRYRPTPLPTPALETPGAPPPAFPVPGGLAMTTPAVEGAREILGGEDATEPKDEVARAASEEDSSSSRRRSSATDGTASSDEDRIGSKLVRRTTGKGFKVREEHQPEHQRSDAERREQASEKIESSRQKARQAKLEERRRSSPTDENGGKIAANLGPAPPMPLAEPSPQTSGSITPVDGGSSSDQQQAESAASTAPAQDTSSTNGHDSSTWDPAQAQAAGTPEHEKPAKDYKREMRKHLQSMMGSFDKMSTSSDKPSAN